MEIKKEEGGEVPLVTITKNIDKIKDNAEDITPVKPTGGNTFFNFNDINPPQPTNQTENAPQEDKPQNKFFNFLEDESANMSGLMGDTNIFNTAPAAMPNAPITQEPETNSINPTPDLGENKFFNLGPKPEENVEPPAPVIPESEPVQETPVLETLFDPMDQVELLDPDYEQKQQEAVGLDLKSAINETRNIIDNLKNKGFNIDTEEIDLDNEYQIIIKIEK